MRVTAVKTDKILSGRTLTQVLDEHLPSLNENSIVAITSKVVGICEGRIVPIGSLEINELVKRESDYFLDPALSKYGLSFSINHKTLVPLAGIDESNIEGNNHALWPDNPQKSTNKAREYLKKRFGLRQVGVVMTDSTARPLHYGTEGVAIAYSGFAPSNNYVGQPDLFGRPFKVSIANIVDALASASVVVMGEGTEQTPIAIIEDVPFVNFQDRNPTQQELDGFYLSHMDDDLFAPFLKNAPWQKGRRSGEDQ